MMSRLALRPRHRFHRRGYALVFFVMFLFAFMALAALVIDIGFARLTQQQMRTAADSGALEGLRGEGSLDYDDRRESARQVVAWHFDDDLDTSGDDGAFDTGSGQFGAGPLIEFTGGAGDPALFASQTMSADPNHPVYKPAMLDGSPSSDGFQVAIQRGVTGVPAADLYSLGPPVPYLFARGSLINRQLIQDGIKVRGMGHAEPRPVLSIGLANDALTPPLTGLAPLALELTYWNGLTTGNADEQPVVVGEIGTVGLFFTIAAMDAMPVTIGRLLPAAATPADKTYTGYVPIYAEITVSATTRVVGFGEAEVEVSGAGTLASITRLPSRIGTENVSAVRCFPVSMSAAEAAELFPQMASVQESLLAPTSVR
jgi:hypothetical protein